MREPPRYRESPDGCHKENSGDNGDSYTNVKAQLLVGRGSTAAQFDYDFSDWSIYNTGGGDSDGVGHYRAKNNTGVIQRNMLTGTCTGTGCCSGYGYTCQ